MRQAIVEAGEHEVFFVADVSGEGEIIGVEALARGNRHGVPALIERAVPGQILLHNHPSGNLTPSDADLSIASVAGNNGIGFAIVDNQCLAWYVVVAPHLPTPVVELAPDDFERAFADGGPLSTMVPHFEVRAEQQIMAQAVVRAFNKREVLLVEAGTGTGKSLAYLLPAIAWSLKNRQRVVVSTNTINLQEQLIKKDLPLIQRYAKETFSTCLVKGRGNYLCQRKLASAHKDPELFPTEGAEALNALVRWAEHTSLGCLSDLSFQPPREVWEEVRSEADQCLRSRCQYFNSCFFYRARREAATANVLVVNHALLLADMALRRDAGYDAAAILPPFGKLIIDEAHHLEEAATGALTLRVSRRDVQKQLGRLVNAHGRSGLLPLLLGVLGRDLPESCDLLYQKIAARIEGGLVPGCMQLSHFTDQQFDILFLACEEGFGPVSSGERSIRVTESVRAGSFWGQLTGVTQGLDQAIREVVHGLAGLTELLGSMPDSLLPKFEGFVTDIEGIRGRLTSQLEALQLFCESPEQQCCWIERYMHRHYGGVVSLAAAPLDVAKLLHTTLFAAVPTVILTSATIAVAGKFSYYKARHGLDLLEEGRLTELMLASPFNYASQALVALVHDMPEPTEKTFSEAVADTVLRASCISRGGVFVLFTSYELMHRIHGMMATCLQDQGLTVFCQGEGLSRHQLLARFRRDGTSVLFGTDSFWEGVDVQGDALRMVIIVRLPFQVPTEPIQQARAELVQLCGGNPFKELSIPQAVLKLRQGFGRLIRSGDDRGTVLILDSRIVTKSYGAVFRKSLPGDSQKQVARADLDATLKAFYGKGSIGTAIDGILP